MRANAAIAAALSRQGCHHVDHDNLLVTIGDGPMCEELQSHIEAIRSGGPNDMPVPVSGEAIEKLKFSSCLPVQLATRVLGMRLADERALRCTLAEPVRYVV